MVYRIARRRLDDHFRQKASDRLQPMPSEELWHLVEASAQTSPLSPADKHDLEYAMKLLTAFKPECRDYLWDQLRVAHGQGSATPVVAATVVIDTSLGLAREIEVRIAR